MNWQLSVPAPALVVHPPAAVSLDEAYQAIELWEHYSRKRLDPAQRLAVELMMAEDASGRWAARTTGRCEPRQNGKGDEFEVVEAWGLLQRGEWIVHTAHEIPTAKNAHRRLVGFLEGHSDLRRKIRQVRYANGDQAIEMVSGGVIVYRTRTSGGGRGLDDISRIVVDEAQHAQPEQLAAATPILAANPNPQTNFVGTAGIENVSDWWWSIRVRALRIAAGEPVDEDRFAYLEHSAEQVEVNQDGHIIQPPVDASVRENWHKANPALGSRIEEGFLAEQLESVLGPRLFAREHLCVWDPYPNQEGGFLPVDEWLKLAIDPPENLGSVFYGLSATETSAAAASAGRLPNGDLYIDILEYKPGTDWVLDDVIERQKRKRQPIRVNPTGPEGAFIRPLREAGVEVIEVTPRAYAQTCAEILDTVKNGTIRHLGQSELDRAVRAVQRRDVGKEGGWVWAESAVDLSPLKAATLALSGVTKRRPPRIHTLEED
jgi:hypothetical protein